MTNAWCVRGSERVNAFCSRNTSVLCLVLTQLLTVSMFLLWGLTWAWYIHKGFSFWWMKSEKISQSDDVTSSQYALRDAGPNTRICQIYRSYVCAALKSSSVYHRICFSCYFIYYIFTENYKYLEDRVVVDGKLITSRAPGTCFEFALAIVEQLVGKEKSHSLIKPLLLNL